MTVSLRAILADITALDADAIVNAANEQLLPGGGVCGAIHRAAGPELAEACALVAPCPAGEARITPGFNLPARLVIHAVGPRWFGGNEGEPELLASAYRAAFRLAKESRVRRIAFPAISTGIFGYPLHPAAAIAVRVTLEVAPASGVEEVTFVCFSEEVLAAYRKEGVGA
jgi:O-acetyl-ADP-ribose deacetylase (regulator of RNase III)